MPFDTIIVVLAVVAMFSTFAVALAWGDRQTRGPRQQATAAARRRGF